MQPSFQVSRPSVNRVQSSHKTPNSPWVEALERAVRAASERAPHLILFHERRSDLRLVASAESGVSMVPTSTSGLCVDPGSGRARASFVSDPHPDDAARLVGHALERRLRPPSRTPRSRDPEEIEPVEAGFSEARDLATEAQQRASRALPAATIVARVAGFVQEVHVARVGRPVVRDIRRGLRLRVEARVGRKGRTASAVVEAARSASGASEPRARLPELIESLGRRLEARLDARAAPDGEWSAVLAPGIGGIFVHELVGHALEADTARDGGSWLATDDARRPTPLELTVIDDPRRGRAAWRIDDEGEAARPAGLLSAGRVVGRLHDRRSAAVDGATASGHGRRASHRDGVWPRMGCTFVAAGTRHPKAVIEGVRRGVMVRRMEAAHVDPRSGRAAFRVTDADAIENGVVSYALRPFLMHVDALRCFADDPRVADDLEFDVCVGSCHRAGQTLAVSVGAPTMWIGVVGIIS